MASSPVKDLPMAKWVEASPGSAQVN